MATKPASPAQQRYLRQLAQQTGTSFSPPSSAADASRQIDDLKRRPGSEPADRFADREAVVNGLAGEVDATAIQAGEISGYGSGAHWAGRPGS